MDMEGVIKYDYRIREIVYSNGKSKFIPECIKTTINGQMVWEHVDNYCSIENQTFATQKSAKKMIDYHKKAFLQFQQRPLKVNEIIHYIK